MTAASLSLAALLVAAVAAPSAAQILGGPQPSAARPPTRTKPKPTRTRLTRPRAEQPAPKPSAGKTKRFADVPDQSIVVPPIDVELDEDQILPITTQLGLITIVEFPDVPDFVWFSDYDRWRVELDKTQLGIAPGKGSSDDVALIDWRKVRETLYVRMKNGFTYKFAITVAPAEGHSVIRVREKVIEPDTSADDQAALIAERAKQEEAERVKEAARLQREAALAAARVAPLPDKFSRSKGLEARVSAPIRIADAFYIRFEVRNRSKRAIDPAVAISAQGVELLWSTAPLEPRASRSGIAIITAPSLATRVLTVGVDGAKPITLPLGGS